MPAARLLDVYQLATPSEDAPSLVQDKTGFAANVLALDATATNGNLLVACVTIRSSVPATPTGWTRIGLAVNTATFSRHAAIYIRVVTGVNPYTTGPAAGEPDDSYFWLDGPVNAHRANLQEWIGSYDGNVVEVDNVASTTNLDCGGAVTVASGDIAVVGVGALGNLDVDYPGPSVTPDASVVELYDGADGSSDQNPPGHWSGYLPVTDASGSYIVGGTISTPLAYCGVTMVVTSPAAGGGSGEAVAFIGTLESAFDIRYRDELHGHGSGQFSICRYDDPAAGTANPECSI